MEEKDQSFLDKHIGLHDLMDVDTIQDLCRAFSTYFNLGVAIYDDADKEVSRIGSKAKFCNLVEGIEAANHACVDTILQTVGTPVTNGEHKTVRCFSGLYYLIIPLNYQMDYLGRAVIGPYSQAGDIADASIFEAHGMDSAQAEKLTSVIRTFTADDAQAMGQFFSTLLDVFLFISAKRLFTTMIHVQTLYKARDDIFKQMQAEVTSPQEKEELEQLKAMF